MITDSHAVEALGYLSAELASRSGAWDGNAPDWFPQPPEWLELWAWALAQTDGGEFATALDAGERSHLLTVGSPTRGLCLRATMGRLSRRGEFKHRQPDVFLIWRGKRV